MSNEPNKEQPTTRGYRCVLKCRDVDDECPCATCAKALEDEQCCLKHEHLTCAASSMLSRILVSLVDPKQSLTCPDYVAINSEDKTEAEWQELINRIRPGLYRHFKGLHYRVRGFAIHFETEELYVIYQAVYGACTVYVRPYQVFASEVDHDKYPNATQKYRFERVGD